MDTKIVNSENAGVSNGDDEKGSGCDDDCDIYEDLDEPINHAPVLDEKREISDEKNDSGSADDIDLYDDLDVVEKQIAAKELEIKVKYLEDRCAKAEQKNEELTLELNTVNKQNLALRRNISSVMKTARAELDRKDREIKDLQRNYDLLVFRRGSARLPREPTVATTENAESRSANSEQAPNDKTTVLPEGIEYSFQMGNVSISFSMEHESFKHRREKHLENLVHEGVSSTTEMGSNKGSNKATCQLEDGEIDDKSIENNNPNGNIKPAPGNQSRDKRRRSRSPTVTNKRKRSPSPDDRRHRTKLRQQSPSRWPEDKPHRIRSCRSPRKSEHSDQNHKPKSRSSHHASRFMK